VDRESAKTCGLRKTLRSIGDGTFMPGHRIVQDERQKGIKENNPVKCTRLERSGIAGAISSRGARGIGVVSLAHRAQ
jgi:hypothetical protein